MAAAHGAARRCIRRLRAMRRPYTGRAQEEDGLGLNMPSTLFPRQCRGAVLGEDAYREAITTALYERQAQRTGKPFVIHDGPPFANGPLHIGHALNKILKDTILRHKVEQGRAIQFFPGWDCHGLPIEQKAIRSGAKPSDTAHVLEQCRAFALDSIALQKKDMQQWALLADYTRPVLTMGAAYESSQLMVLADFVDKGLVFLDKRPVHWSPASRTALAEAELEYVEDHTSTAAFVAFPICTAGGLDEDAARPPHALLWTTTPWTVPANQAIAINSNLDYVIIAIASIPDKRFVIAKDRLAFVEQFFGGADAVTVIASIAAEHLAAATYTGLDGKRSPILEAPFVTNCTGTGLVHMAPAYGSDDFVTCRAVGIVEREVIDQTGTFVWPPQLRGRDILNGDHQGDILAYLQGSGCLVHAHEHRHRYPYDWRAKRPVIQMATRQVFVSIESMQAQLRDAISTMAFTPASGRRRMESMTSSRSSWCISRQRSWGVPIPIFYGKEDGAALLDGAIIRHVAALFGSSGGSALWWRAPLEDLLPPSHRHLAPLVERGRDTLDVWFDSGSFWRAASPDAPADVYIEGGDQFRGWFQSSLITSVVSRGVAPCSHIVSHGFVLDGAGCKMSKSLGNVLDAKEVIGGGEGVPYRGVDVLRLVMTSLRLGGDVHVSKESIEQAQELYKKVRITLRFIIGNADAAPAEGGRDEISPALARGALRRIDRYVVGQTVAAAASIDAAFDRFDFGGAITLLDEHIRSDLSSFYFDIAKDRLYLSPSQGEDSGARQAVQHVLYRISQTLLGALRPLTPFLCEEFADYCRREGKLGAVLQASPQGALHRHALHGEDYLSSKEEEASFASLRALRAVVRSRLHRLQAKGLLSAPQQAIVHVDVGGQPFSRSMSLPLQDLCELLMVSAVVDSGEEGLPSGELTLHGAFGASRLHSAPSRAIADADAHFSNVAILAEDGAPLQVSLKIEASALCKCPRCWMYLREASAKWCPSCLTMHHKGVDRGEMRRRAA